MTTYLALKLAHLIAMVYWLGGDLGTYYSSRFVVDPRLSPAQRHTALKIMLGCDQGPKLCMPLIFAIGFSMATQMRFIEAPAAVTVAVWMVALLWFANVNYLYFTSNQQAKARIAQIDLWFRVVVVLGLIVAGGAALLGHGFIRADWLAVKFLVFALLVACGIYIRIQLKPFVAAFGQLMTQGSSAEVEATLSRSIGRCRPAVYLIWAGIVLSAALGLHLIPV
jgi:uncharacterized membrane protein